ncbi:MAG: PilN domain-containing protein [Nitrospirota bacterium]
MISINFATRNYRFITLLTQALGIGSVILLLAAGGIFLKTVVVRHDLGSMQEKMKKVEASYAAVASTLAERERLTKDLSAMSGLIDARKFSWTHLLTSIESVTPTGLAFKKIGFNPRDHGLVLEGIARSPESLRNLMVKMEKSPSFKDVYLKHQSLEKGSITFNVVAVYQAAAHAAVPVDMAQRN